MTIVPSYLTNKPLSANVPFGHLGTLLLGAPYPTFFAEFCFDAARTVISLTSSETLQNFTHIDYQLPHEGDAWPSVEDRFPKSRPPAVETSSKEIYNTRYAPHGLSNAEPSPTSPFSPPRSTTHPLFRFWYDSAGPVFYNQVKRLLGTDYPTCCRTRPSNRSPNPSWMPTSPPTRKSKLCPRKRRIYSAGLLFERVSESAATGMGGVLIL